MALDVRIKTGAPDREPTRETDFFGWLAEQAAHARAGRTACLDLAGIADEFEELMSDKIQEIENRLVILYQYLLKYQALPDRRSSGWIGSIAEQRQRLCRLISRNPNLRGELERALADHDCYIDGRDRALAEFFAAGIRIDLPEVTPWSPTQVLDLDFWPGEGLHPELTDRQRGRRKPASR